MAANEDQRIGSEAVQRLYDQHSTELNAFLLGVLRDRDLVSEALQATFVKAIEHGHTAKQETIKGWLFRVAFNEAMTIRRKQTIHKKALSKLAWLQPGAVSQPGTSKPGQRATAGSKTEAEDCGFVRAVRAETIEQIRAAIGQLPHAQQYVVQARIYDQKKFADIAKELDVPLGTVLTRMRLAMSKLSTLLSTLLNSDE